MDLVDKNTGAPKARCSKNNPCPECYGWWLSYSTCGDEKYVCKTCGRPQCLLHWKYPMQSEDEAIRFLRWAEACTGKKCFVGKATVPTEESSARYSPRKKTMGATQD